jgi:MoaE-MoaD fusion protein
MTLWRIKVLFFGVLRDLAGQRECEVELAEGTTAAGLFGHFAAKFPGLEAARRSVTVARNQEFADPETVLADGDEVALLPPVSGGSGPWIHQITTPEKGNFYALTRQPIAAAAVARELLQGVDGAFVNFEGVVRNNSGGRATRFLDYEGYEPMALKVIAEIGREMAVWHGIGRIAIVHRLGRLEIGEASVSVVVASPHRAAAFDAVREAMDLLKTTGADLEEGAFRGRRSVGGGRMGRIAAAAVAWAMVLLAPAGAPGQQQQEEEPAPVFKVDVRLVRMLATVKSPQGGLVGGLEKDEFKIFDNGVEQEIAIFERRTEQPLSIAMVVDTSRSTERERRYELDSIRRFLEALLREGNDGGPSSAVQLQHGCHAAHELHAGFAAAGAGVADAEERRGDGDVRFGVSGGAGDEEAGRAACAADRERRGGHGEPGEVRGGAGGAA